MDIKPLLRNDLIEVIARAIGEKGGRVERSKAIIFIFSRNKGDVGFDYLCDKLGVRAGALRREISLVVNNPRYKTTAEDILRRFECTDKKRNGYPNNGS